MHSGCLGDTAVVYQNLECLVGGGDQEPGKGKTFLLIGIQQSGIRTPTHDFGDLPRQVDRIADAGVHSLALRRRAVDVAGITGNEHPPTRKCSATRWCTW